MTISKKQMTKKRLPLKTYFFQGGDKSPFCTFQGIVSKIYDDNNKIVIAPIWFEINNEKYKIDHITLYYIDQFLKLNIQEGDLISFNACTYMYERKDETISYGLRFYNNIKKHIQ